MPDTRPRVEGDREAEIFDATVELLASAGYDRLTMDAVAAAAKASKATLYRRWASKAELVMEAIVRVHEPHTELVAPRTGSLRGDLLEAACCKGGLADDKPLGVMAAVLTALHRDEEFAEAFQQRFLNPRIAVLRSIYEDARRRGEIRADVDLDLLTSLLPAIIVHRSFVLRKPVDEQMVAKIIDEIVIPAATRRPPTRPRRKKRA
ncbi:MAG: TetR/AcrR family transcriptional regulator [Nocardioidaceae bacterium]|nr:TetR/AcrR family transcriptional regulator [Nocardioidaceae bacterium]